MSGFAGTSLLVATVLALGAVACGGDSRSGANFTPGELSTLVLESSQAPPGTEVTKVSGRDILEREGGLERVLKRLREVGFVAI